MTDAELIAWVRNGFGNVAADRIEALVKESAEMEAEAHAHIELWGKALREKAAAEARAATIREAALREAATLCFKNADGITEAVSAFPQIKKRRVLLQRAEQAKVDAAAILALIQKGGDACDKDDDPTNARPETSPGVTAGAISKGAAK